LWYNYTVFVKSEYWIQGINTVEFKYKSTNYFLGGKYNQRSPLPLSIAIKNIQLIEKKSS